MLFVALLRALGLPARSVRCRPPPTRPALTGRPARTLHGRDKGCAGGAPCMAHGLPKKCAPLRGDRPCMQECHSVKRLHAKNPALPAGAIAPPSA